MSTIQTEDGLSLEADWINASGKPVGVIVFCHPDPRQGGTMRAPLVRSVAGYLGRDGFHVLRFNFRGVGRSEGSWGGGDAEIHDVAAAMAAAATTHPDLPLGIAGWSFGAITALRWQAASASTDRYVGIAPALRLGSGPRVVPAAGALTPADRLFVIGGKDQYTATRDLELYAGEIGARVAVLPGSDHFFYFRHDHLAQLAAGHFRGGAKAT